MHGQHLGAHVLRGIDRRHREIAALDARTVAEIAGLVVGAVVGRQFGGVELEAGVVGIGLVLDVVEHEELGFRADNRWCRRRLPTSGRPRPSWRCRAGRGCRARRRPGRGCRRGRPASTARRTGRYATVSGSGISTMSDSLIAFQPAIEEPSNMMPSANMSSSTSTTSIVTCCSLPLRVGEAQVDEFDVLVLDLLQDVFGCRHVMLPCWMTFGD